MTYFDCIAVGTLFLPGAYVTNPVVQKFRTLLANPFSMTIAGSCSAVIVGSIIVPPWVHSSKPTPINAS